MSSLDLDLEFDAIERHAENESASVLIERRWFAAVAAAKAAAAECAIRREVMEMALTSFRMAHSKLVGMEALRDALEAEMSDFEHPALSDPHARREAGRPAA